MLEPLFFSLGLANSLFLLFIFIIRRNHLALLKKVGWLYLLLAIPAVAGLLLVRQEGKDYPLHGFPAHLPGFPGH